MEDAKNSSYVSLGAALRVDDRFVKLLEHEPGGAYIKNEEGVFVELN